MPKLLVSGGILACRKLLLKLLVSGAVSGSTEQKIGTAPDTNSIRSSIRTTEIVSDTRGFGAVEMDAEMTRFGNKIGLSKTFHIRTVIRNPETTLFLEYSNWRHRLLPKPTPPGFALVLEDIPSFADYDGTPMASYESLQQRDPDLDVFTLPTEVMVKFCIRSIAKANHENLELRREVDSLRGSVDSLKQEC
ncbi:hypothetical protein B0H16DRAFT_1465744 [Mycena metata]|uniref:Peptidase S74 domain-containing protein n=1 Tax=Mycena metata TaxID=1033252 RepID=A0AAD7IAU4_9AGAR|nr:hypothetical protein B0H16DRAFT_1465744 [Mycena metata]